MRNATTYRFNDRNHNISNPLNEPKLFETVHEHKECCKEQEGAPLNVDTWHLEQEGEERRQGVLHPQYQGVIRPQRLNGGI